MSGSKSRNLRLLPENGNEPDVPTGKYFQIYRSKYSRYARRLINASRNYATSKRKGITFG